MKRIFILQIFAFFATIIFASPYTIKPGLQCDQYANHYTLTFNMPNFEVFRDTLSDIYGDYYFSYIQPLPTDEFDYLEEDGRPELPFYSIDLMLPINNTTFHVSNVTILDSVKIDLPYDYRPAQQRDDLSTGFSYDNSYYGSSDNTWYWQYYSIDESNYRFYKGLNFAIFPCKYNPLDRTLIVITSAKFDISFDGTNLLNYISSDLDAHDRLAYNFFDNFIEYPYSFIPPIDGEEYLIITADQWEDESALSTFIEHKTSLGYNVTLTALHNIGNNPDSDDIRDYIKSLYDKCQTMYVLLVGNVSDISTTNMPFYSGTQDYMLNPPSDLYYSCLSKNNVSNQWMDLNPSVFLGRWPVTSSAQLENIVKKTIKSDMCLGIYTPDKIALFSGDGNCWEGKQMYNDCKYIYNNLIQPASSSYSGDLIDGRDPLIPDAFTYMKNFLEDTSVHPTWLFVYDGHGSSSCISSPYHMCNIDIGSVTTSALDFQPFGFGFACRLGNIYENYNFARAWITDDDGGVSFLGATTKTTFASDKYFSRKLFIQMKNKPVMTIGEFIGNGKAKYYNPDKVVWRMNEAKKYVLYGDPSLFLSGLDFDYRTPLMVKKHTQHLESEDVNVIIENNILRIATDNVESVYIYSITGQLLLAQNANMINLQSLPAGMYSVVIDINHNHITKKFIKQ